MSAAAAMRESAVRGAIVTVDLAQVDLDELKMAADDWITNGAEVELWTSEWRVHVRLPVPRCPSCGDLYAGPGACARCVREGYGVEVAP